MFKKKKKIILLAEHGWQGMRQCALDFAQEGHEVTVLIKGRPSKEERNLISKKKNIKNIFIPRRGFSTLYPFILLYEKCLRKVPFVIYQTPKAKKIVQFLFHKTACKELRELSGAPYYHFI